MILPALLAALTMMATIPNLSSDDLQKTRPATEPTTNVPVMGSNTPEPEATLVSVGDPAPDISYLDLDGHWGRLHDLLGHGAVMLVFGADEPELTALQREREVLVGLGVIPVAIADMRAGAVRSLAQRLKLSYPVYPDPRGIAASQFNSLDANSLHPVPAWFVVDHTGRVRQLGRGSLPSHWAATAATALGLPAPDATRAIITR